MSAETEKALREATEILPRKRVADLCRSCASFIAEIDSSSEDVAAYLEQRLAAILVIAYQNGGIEAFGVAEQDGRRLVRKT